jgi:hypothetical protein
MNNSIAGKLDFNEALLHAKALEPLSEAMLEELSRIVNLNQLESYSEADVREEVITPILRTMGYAKESAFSVGRETTLNFLDKRLSVDYSITLWQENFWIIEAKKPNVTKGKFKYKQLWQAVQYAVHPEINAALVVLCDGHALEIFDREESLEEPILRVERKNLIRDFDKIRVLLGPLQAWFFQKRRIIRLIDKVLDKEFQLGRMEEIRQLTDSRLRAKEQQTISNRRALIAVKDFADEVAYLKGADTYEIIESTFFVSLPKMHTDVAVAELINQSTPWAFPVLHKVFPDTPRAANDHYYMNALNYLIQLGEKQKHLNWLPHWLSGARGAGAEINVAIKKLIKLCLSHFKDDPERKTILLYANGIRRLCKIGTIIDPQFQKYGDIRHALQRYVGNEFTFAQVISSPSLHLLQLLDRLEVTAIYSFITENSSKHDKFQVETAKLALTQLWQTERTLLNSVPDYISLLKERDLGEMHATEAIGIRYDQLGHCCLCVLEQYPKWKAHALEHQYQEVQTLANIGSWQARNWLEIKSKNQASETESDFANRFFFGDIEMSKALCDAYGFK